MLGSSADASEVLLALRLGELAGDALPGDPLNLRCRSVSELCIPDLHATGFPGIHDRDDALAVRAEPNRTNGTSTSRWQYGQLLAGGCVEYRSAAVSAGNHDLSTVKARRCHAEGPARVERGHRPVAVCGPDGYSSAGRGRHELVAAAVELNVGDRWTRLAQQPTMSRGSGPHLHLAVVITSEDLAPVWAER